MSAWSYRLLSPLISRAVAVSDGVAAELAKVDRIARRTAS